VGCTYQQAEAFFARQTGWLRAKQEHDDRERDRRLKSLAAPGAGGKRRGGSAKPKLVSTADAEAFFASEVACKQRREEAMEKLREEARLKAAAREAAGDVDCCTHMRYGLTLIAFHELYKSARCACGSFLSVYDVGHCRRFDSHHSTPSFIRRHALFRLQSWRSARSRPMQRSALLHLRQHNLLNATKRITCTVCPTHPLRVCCTC
jgi:hypothetical protein